jgi:chaperonin GroEL (HSP60 family)
MAKHPSVIKARATLARLKGLKAREMHPSIVKGRATLARLKARETLARLAKREADEKEAKARENLRRLEISKRNRERIEALYQIDKALTQIESDMANYFRRPKW